MKRAYISPRIETVAIDAADAMLTGSATMPIDGTADNDTDVESRFFGLDSEDEIFNNILGL